MTKRKTETELHMGDGKTWFRGSMIGRGGFGSVYMATLKKPRMRYSSLPLVMAVKSAGVSEAVSLMEEKGVMDKLAGCPGLIECLGNEITRDENGNMFYNLLLEYASGGTLYDHIKRSNGRGLPELEVRRYARSIVRGLYHLHSRDYVHCDLKPDNILLFPYDDNKFSAKICDFGLVKRASKFEFGMRGAFLYRPPETVIESLQEKPADIWALGCIVLEMLTGKNSWENNEERTSEDFGTLIFDEQAVPDVPDEISREAKEFLRGCFQRKVSKRSTAKMLLYHPFVSGIEGDEEYDEGIEKGLSNIEEVEALEDEESEDWEGWSSDEDDEISCSS